MEKQGNAFRNLAFESLLANVTLPQGRRAKRVIQIFLSGAASSVDLYDYKPQLEVRKGQPFTPGGKVEIFQSQPGVVMPSPWGWSQHGKSGRWMSHILPRLSECVDDMAFIYSMKSISNVHGPATFLQTTGFVQPGFPSMGAWVAYGLGNLVDDLPVFVALPDSRGVPPNGPANWGAGFLPAATQGVVIRPGSATPIRDLKPIGAGINAHSEKIRGRLLQQLNQLDRQEYGDDDAMTARIKSHALAARLQLSAPAALDISKESGATKALYGLGTKQTHDLGTRCLIARRLVERGVRFVQLWSGADNGFPRRNWDSHEDLQRDHGDMATELDTPVAGLLKDLKARGLLEDTIVLCTSEFGRMPCSQPTGTGRGRDHNPESFATWLAGGGVKGGTSIGTTDEWGYRVVDNPVTGYDVHATVLALMGVDHTRLTYRHNGVNRRLTDVHGHVLKSLIA